MPSIIVLISAKSRLMIPVIVMISEIPWTPCRRMSSAMRKASKKLVPLSTNSMRRSFGMQITVSTAWLNSVSPYSACVILRRPSNANGFVTTATVSAPSSRARLATMGAPPVPVPPPSPAVTKTMSAPSRASTILSVSSSAAARPTSGLAPAPSPFVSFAPSWILSGALDISSAWRSVFATMNSTPSTLAAIIRLTAFPPPPPTPITLILAPRRMLSEKSTRNSSACPLSAMFAPSRRLIRSQQQSSVSRASQNSPKFSHQTLVLMVLQQTHPFSVRHKPDNGRVRRVGQNLIGGLHVHRIPHSNRQSQNLFREGRESAQLCSAPRENNAGAQLVFQVCVIDFGFDQLQQFDRARFDDFPEFRVIDDPCRSLANTRNFQSRRFRQAGILPSPKALDLLGLRDRSPQPHCDIVSKVLAADRNRGRVSHAAVMVNDHARRSGPKVHEGNSQLAIVRSEAGLRASQRLKNRSTFGDLDPCTVDGRNDVLPRQGRSRHQVDVRLEPSPHHSYRIPNAVLRIQQKLLRKNVQQFPVSRQRDTLGRTDHLADVFAPDAVAAISNRYAAARIDAANVRPAHADIGHVNWNPRSRFRSFNRLLNRKHRSIQIDDKTFAPSLGFGYPQAGYFQFSRLLGIANHRTGLAAAEIESNQCQLFMRQGPLNSSSSCRRRCVPRTLRRHPGPPGSPPPDFEISNQRNQSLRSFCATAEALSSGRQGAPQSRYRRNKQAASGRPAPGEPSDCPRHSDRLQKHSIRSRPPSPLFPP